MGRVYAHHPVGVALNGASVKTHLTSSIVILIVYQMHRNSNRRVQSFTMSSDVRFAWQLSGFRDIPE